MGPENATDNPNLIGSQVYEGQLLVNMGRPLGVGNNQEVTMADRIVTNNLFVWVKGENIVGCGITKNPSQVCADDLGGTYNPQAAPGTPQCTNIKTPCANQGDFYLGISPTTNTPQCIPSPASCTTANETVVYQNGGWQCVAMP